MEDNKKRCGLNYSRTKKLYLTKEFDEQKHLERFLDYISKDEKFISKVPKRYVKNGLFSAGVRFLIEEYNDTS